MDTPKNAKVMAVQSFESLHTFISWQPCWWVRERPQPIFPYNIIENSPTSFASNSVFVGLNNFKFGTETRFVALPYRPYQNLGQIGHNLQNHVFDDVICKPPIVPQLSKCLKFEAVFFWGGGGGEGVFN